ncbi:hypothetical protein [Proteocatella sphenisci]|uniref:hypothetical protein n=1 Tax=Proteocatella sphenisci TaxID=181070 RepID=UPI00048FA2BA|nr:hypothetical protein [Proteocatella sphenisci]
MGLRFRKSFTISKGVKSDIGKIAQDFNFGNTGLRKTIISNRKLQFNDNELELHTEDTSFLHKEFSKEIINGNIEEYKGDAKTAINEYKKVMDMITEIHRNSDESIDWNYVYKSPEPFNINALGPNALEVKEQIDNYIPTASEKIFKTKLEKKLSNMKNDLRKAMEKDEETYNGWRTLVDLAGEVLRGNIDAYFEVINEMRPLDDLLEFGVDFEFGSNSSDTIHVEYVADSSNTVPFFELSLSSNGKLQKNNFKRSQHNEIIRLYIAASAIRIAKDMFALLPIEKTVVHIVDDYINEVITKKERVTVLSVEFERDKLEKAEMKNKDPLEILKGFNHNMKFTKAYGFSPVDRI